MAEEPKQTLKFPFGDPAAMKFFMEIESASDAMLYGDRYELPPRPLDKPVSPAVEKKDI